ncbi:MAG: ABC transporter permease, partial [Acidobacteriota bacterium]
MDLLVVDLRFAAKQLRRSPGFAAVAILTLALGIGATTAVFSVADAVVLRPLPYPEPGRLVAVYETDTATGDERDTFSGATFLDWRAMSTSFEELAAFRNLAWTLTGPDAPRRVNGVSVTPNFFEVFRADAELGRLFSTSLDPPGGDSVAVISHSMWQRDYAGAHGVLGQQLVLNGEAYTIVGVLPPAFDFPYRVDAPTEVWTAAHFRVPDPPIDLGEDPSVNRGAGYLSAVARLADGVTAEDAQAEMTLIAEQLAAEYPDTSDGEGVSIVPLRTSISGDARPLLLALLAAVALVMLIACSNVANLLLAKASQRRQEIAMRVALGASHGRLLSQLLTESVVLAGVAGVAGIVLARLGIDALLAIAPIGLPGAETATLDLRVLAFSLATVLGAAILFGLAPTLSALRPDLRCTVREGAASIASRRGQRRLGRVLIIAEVSMSLLLVIGAGLMGRTFFTLSSIEPGFDPTNTLVAHVALPDAKYGEDYQIVGMFNRVVSTLQETPGIESAGSVLTLPMHWNLRGTLRVNIDGGLADEEDDTLAGFQLITPGYFQTLRIPLVRGRLFDATDAAGAPSVALVNEAFVARYFPGEDALGKRLTWSDPEDEDWATIVGIVADVHLEGLDTAAVPETYLPYAQAAMPYTTFVVRSSRDRADLTAIVRQAVLEADPDQPITGVATMEEVLRDSLG